jgi:hypothetical protein
MLAAAIAVPRMILKIVDMNFSPAGSREQDDCPVLRVRGDWILCRQIPSRVFDYLLLDRSKEAYATKKIHAHIKRLTRFQKRFTRIQKRFHANQKRFICIGDGIEYLRVCEPA